MEISVMFESKAINFLQKELGNVCKIAAILSVSNVLNMKFWCHFQIEGDYLTMAGRPGPAISKIADEFNADLVLVGTRGKGKVRRTILGSVSDYVVNHAPCPVITVRMERPLSGRWTLTL